MRRAVQRFADDELALGQRRQVAAHLRRCPKCRRAVLALTEMKQALRRLRSIGPPALAAHRLRRFAATITDSEPGARWRTST